MSLWMGPLSYLYQTITDVKNDLFARKKLKIHKVAVPVLSIGNLTVGGTGKTPFVDYTIRYFLERGKKVGVVARAYKAQARAPVRVDADPTMATAAAVFGDEPVWLARKNPSASVFVGQSKWQIAQWGLAQEKLDVLIVDDGFQHRRLHRDLDIVILDATEKWDNYRPLPVGRAREKFEHISRAQVVVISKCNWAWPEQLEYLRLQIPENLLVIETGSRIFQLRNFRTGEVRSASEFASKRALAFSSIARPDVFSKVIGDIFSEVQSLPFPDHHQYMSDDIESILRKKGKFQLEYICCTEKDAVKLENLWPEGQELWVSELALDILKNETKLHEIYNQFCS